MTKGQLIQSLIRDAGAFEEIVWEKKISLQLQDSLLQSSLPGKDMASQTITRRDFLFSLVYV